MTEKKFERGAQRQKQRDDQEIYFQGTAFECREQKSITAEKLLLAMNWKPDPKMIYRSYDHAIMRPTVIICARERVVSNDVGERWLSGCR